MAALAVPIENELEIEMKKALRTVSVSRKALAAEVAACMRVVEKKSTIPVLSCVLVDLGRSGITLTATDLEVGVQSACVPVQVVARGSFWRMALPAKQLRDTLKSLSADEVTITPDETRTKVTIRSGAAEITLDGMSAESYPELPVPNRCPTCEGKDSACDQCVKAEAPAPVLRVGAAELHEAIKMVRCAISKEESRFTLRGALLDIREGVTRMVATDGHRLAHVVLPAAQTDSTVNMLLRTGLLDNVSALCAPKGKQSCAEAVEVRHDGNHAYFDIGPRRVLGRKLTGKFPDYERVLWGPDAVPLHGCVVDVEAFAGALKRALKYADERSPCAKLDISDAGMVITTMSSDRGKFQEKVECRYAFTPHSICAVCKGLTHGADVTAPCATKVVADGKQIVCGGRLVAQVGGIQIGLNIAYLLDYLAAISEPATGLLMMDAKSACELRPVGNAAYRHVLMPVRI